MTVLGLTNQSVSASTTDTKFRLGELGVGSNQLRVCYHRGSLTLRKKTITLSFISNNRMENYENMKTSGRVGSVPPEFLVCQLTVIGTTNQIDFQT